MIVIVRNVIVIVRDVMVIVEVAVQGAEVRVDAVEGRPRQHALAHLPGVDLLLVAVAHLCAKYGAALQQAPPAGACVVVAVVVALRLWSCQGSRPAVAEPAAANWERLSRDFPRPRLPSRRFVPTEPALPIQPVAHVGRWP